MFALLQKWHERAGGGEALKEADVSDRERLLDKFLRSCSVQQLELLRGIALKSEGGANNGTGQEQHPNVSQRKVSRASQHQQGPLPQGKNYRK
jgi:hypothetical protein